MQNKPKLLVFPFNLLSHYVRSIELCKHYTIDYSVLFKESRTYVNLLKDENIDTFQCKEFDVEFVMQSVKKFQFDWLNEQDLENIFLDQVRCINEYKPAMVIGDMSVTLKMATEYTNTKYISLINGYMSKYYALQRPITSMHPAAYIEKMLPSFIFKYILKNRELKKFKDIHQPFKTIRKKYRLKEFDSYLDELEGNETILCDNPQIFPQHQLPSNYKIIGPLFYNPSTKKSSEIAIKKETDKKSILVSFGSSGEWEKIKCLNNSIFSNYNIYTAGDKNQLLKAEHIIPLDFSDFNQLLPHINLLICHGGNGTLNLAHKHKIPFIAFPSIMEQEWNSLRFQEIGIGKTFSKPQKAEKLNQIISELI